MIWKKFDLTEGLISPAGKQFNHLENQRFAGNSRKNIQWVAAVVAVHNRLMQQEGVVVLAVLSDQDAIGGAVELERLLAPIAVVDR